MLSVVGLFSGIGGFELGFRRAGFDIAAVCEIEPYAQAVLRKHFPETRLYGDIKELTHERLQRDGIRADIVTGGFPCQDISLAGKGAGLGGERSGLWFEMHRVIAETRPRWVVAENVAALRSRGLDQVLGSLATIGYDAEWHCIPASAVGAPHRRDRIWIVAYPARLQPGREEQRAIGERVGPGGQPQPVADADEHAGQQRGPGDPEQSEGGRDANRGAVGANGMGNPHQPRLEIRLDGHTRKLSAAERAGWWLSEPDVGRVAARLPSGLYGDLNAHKSCIEKARSKSVPSTNRLQFLRRYLESSAPSPGPQRCAFCSHPLSALPCEGRCTPWKMGPGAKEVENLRCMREGIPSLLAQPEQDMLSLMPVGPWQTEREQTLGRRVDRLRALGNAVVPQIPEIIADAIALAELTA